jgi:subfamily B ATP-binding cassette protein MsbA
MIEWRLVVVALVALPVAAIVIRTFGKLAKRAQRRASQSWGRLLDHLGERLAGIRAVKAYNMQGAEARRFEAEGRRLTHAQTQIELLDAGIKPALETLATVAAAAFILYGANLVFTGRLDAHLFIAAVVCLGGIFDPVRKMGNVNNRLQAADVSAQRLFELLDLPAEPVARPDRDATLPRLERSIEFRDVSFAYPAQPDRVVLDSVSLTVKCGQAVALVGPNGSGKTTLVSLLLRFFEPTAGDIRIDGRNIASVNIESLRGQIGLVTQDAVIFSDTVRDNIAYGVNGVGEQSLRAAARHAHIDEFIQGLKVENNGEVATGYDAPINARSLSGGQRQRLALARAILRDPPILILDEATSQVDSESERRIQEALDDVMRDRTTIIIAHRFSTIARADVIVVMSEGRIIATGKHADLLESCSFYASFCETQFAAVSEPRGGGEP